MCIKRYIEPTLSVATFAFIRSPSLVAKFFAFSGLDRASMISPAPRLPLRCFKYSRGKQWISKGGATEEEEAPCPTKTGSLYWYAHVPYVACKYVAQPFLSPLLELFVYGGSYGQGMGPLSFPGAAGSTLGVRMAFIPVPGDAVYGTLRAAVHTCMQRLSRRMKYEVPGGQSSATSRLMVPGSQRIDSVHRCSTRGGSTHLSFGLYI